MDIILTCPDHLDLSCIGVGMPTKGAAEQLRPSSKVGFSMSSQDICDVESIEHSIPMLHWCNTGAMGVACRKKILTYINHWNEARLSTYGMERGVSCEGGYWPRLLTYPQYLSHIWLSINFHKYIKLMLSYCHQFKYLHSSIQSEL